MASEEKSFENLLKEAPLAPAAGTVSVVGMLAKASEAEKFVLTLQDGSAVTLETASVKGYAVLGTSVGQTIVRVDVDAGKIPTVVPNDNTQSLSWVRTAGGCVPFALAAPHQVASGTLAALQGPFGVSPLTGWLDFHLHTAPILDSGGGKLAIADRSIPGTLLLD